MQQHQVKTDGRTVWVNSGKSGCCLARFCPLSGEVMPDVDHPEYGNGYLARVKPPARGYRTTTQEWYKFIDAVKEHHGIDIPQDLIRIP
jgi:hypothetical protein